MTVSRAQPQSASPSERHQVADFHWLWRFIRDHRWSAVAAIVSGMVAGVTAAAEPYLLGVIIDKLRTSTTTTDLALQATNVHQTLMSVETTAFSLSELTRDALLLLGLSVLTVIAFLGQRYFSGQVAYDVHYDVRQVLFKNLLTLEQGFFQQYATGDLMSRMHADADLTWRLLALTLTRVGSAVLTVIATFVLLATVSLPLTLVVFVVLTVSTALQIRAGRVLAPVFEDVQDQAGVVSALVQDSVSGIKTIKTTGTEAHIAEKFREENDEYRRRWLYFKRRNEPVGMLPNMISELTAAIVVLIGGYLTVRGDLTIGNFVQFLFYLGLISIALLHLGMIYQRFQQTKGALQRLTPLLKTAAIRDQPEPRSLDEARGEITLENVGVKIGDDWLLRDINLHIPAGTVVGLVGPTGAGKTLLVSLIARVLDPTEGRVLIDGEDIRKTSLEDVRRASSYVPQTTFLFSQELHRNVRLGKWDITDEELDGAIHISRMSNDLEQLPRGLETLVGERGVMLSGGQKQRVAIARALVRDPSILILDDAFSSVDTHTAADILSDLRHVLRSRTSIIIAHRMATVKDADMIVVLEEGRIAEQGTHADLVHGGGLYTEMVEREMNSDDREIIYHDEE